MGKRWIASGLLLLLLAVAGCGGAKQARPGTGPAAAPGPGPEGPVAGTQPQVPQATPHRGGPAPAQRCTVPEPEAKPGYMTLYVYFTCEDDQLPAQPRRVPRQVPETQAVLHTALEELLKGPTAAERAVGLHSWFSGQTAGMLQEAELKDGRAVIDFQNFASIIPNASTSAGSSMLIREVGKTTFQFGDVSTAEVRFAGSCEAFWGWLQRDCQVLEAGRFR
jgi:hypothetical protein